MQGMLPKALNVSVITYRALKTKVITCNVNVVISVCDHWVLHRRSEMQTRDSSHRKADL